MSKKQKAEWELNFNYFVYRMKNKIIEKIPEKGLSWRESEEGYLLNLLDKHISEKDYIDCANIIFMLWEKRLGDKY
jgi:hypothetical protein